MRNFILTEKSSSTNISSTRVVLLPSSFRIEVKIESSNRCFLYQIIDDSGKILTWRRLIPTPDYQMLIPHLNQKQKNDVIKNLSEAIEFELLYFICHGRHYGSDDCIDSDDLENDQLEFNLEEYADAWTMNGVMAIEQAISCK